MHPTPPARSLALVLAPATVRPQLSEAAPSTHRTPLRSPAGLTTAWVASLIAALAIAWFSPSPFADASGVFTDHLHHPYAAWVFLEKGAEVFSRPLGEAAAGVEYRHANGFWLDVPFVYPPGAALLFVPMATAGQYLPLSPATYARACATFVTLLAQLALAAALAALWRQRDGFRALVAFFVWLQLFRCGIEGFFDVAWIGAGAMASRDVALNRGRAALLWICVAALLHHRAVALTGVGAAALALCCRGDWRRWPWATFAVVATVGAIDVWSLLQILPYSPLLHSLRGTIWSNFELSRLFGVASLTVAAGAALLWLRDWPTALAVAVTGVIALIDPPRWWHASMLAAVALTATAGTATRSPRTARAITVGWAIFVQPIAWSDWAFRLFPTLAALVT